MKPLNFANHLTPEELKQRYLNCKVPRETRRWHSLWLISRGFTPEEAADVVGFKPDWIRKVIRRYNEFGPDDGVYDGHVCNPGGNTSYLNEEQQARLIKAIKEESPPGGGLWSGPKVAKWIEKQIGRKVNPGTGWDYLQRLGLSLKVPRPKNKKAASPEEQEAFQKEVQKEYEDLKKNTLKLR